MDRRRHDDLVALVALAHHREHLLDVERVSLRRLDDALARLGVESRIGHEVLDQLLALVLAERLEQQRSRVELPASPAGPRVEELGSRHAEEEDRRVAREIGDVLDEVEERRLGPLEIVEEDDLRPLRARASSSRRKASWVSAAELPSTASGSTPLAISISTSGQYVIPSP